MNLMHELWLAYRMRWKRRRLLFRAFRKRRQLQEVANKSDTIQDDAVLCFSTVRNERLRLPYFLKHHRLLGVDHFIFVDNGSTDGTQEYLAEQSDVSVWTTSESYRLSRFGVDWLTWLQIRIGHGHWCLTLDADELFIYPHHEARDLRALIEFLDRQNRESMGALMIELYPKGKLTAKEYSAGDNPLEVVNWFDSDNYREQYQERLQNIWVQGGIRERRFFSKRPERSPTLNKIPFLKYNRRYVYVSSTHSLLPRKLNHVFPNAGADRVTGAILHTKFLPMIVPRAAEERSRKEHFENSELYDDYYRELAADPDLWHSGSTRYQDWRQLEELGLMSRGDWQ